MRQARSLLLMIALAACAWLVAGRSSGASAATPTPTSGFIILQPTPTKGILILRPSRTPTSPSSSVQTPTRTPTVTTPATVTPTLPSFTLPSPAPTDGSFSAELPPSPTPHGDPYVPDFDLAVASSTPTPGSFTGPDLPQVDLRVTDIEVTQGLQSLDNDMPLVELRMTYARVYVRSEGAGWFPVQGILEGWRDGEYLGMRAPENGPIPAFAGGGDRTNVDHTLNFRLPSDWRYGQVTLRAFIYSQDPQSPYDEEPFWVNNFREVEVEFHLAQGVSMSLWPIHLHQDYDGTKPEVVFTEDDPDAATVLSGMERLLPGWGVFLHAPPIEKLYCATWSGGEVGVGLEGGPDVHGPCEFNLLAPGGAQDVNADMALIDFLTDDNWDNVINYGMVHPSFVDDMTFYNDQGNPLTYTGLALFGQAHGVMDVSTWATTPWQMSGGETLAHEVGHRLGLGHVECAGNEELGGGLDPDFPWTLADCAIAQLNPSGFYGFDVYYSDFPGLSGPTAISNDPAAPEPNRGFPLMSYQPPKWLDAYHWCKVLGGLGVSCDLDTVPFLAQRRGLGLMAPVPAAPFGHADLRDPLDPRPAEVVRQGTEGYLLVAGRVDRPSNAAEFRQVLHVPGLGGDDRDDLLAGPGLFREPSAYSLVLMSAEGEVLSSTPLYDTSDAHGRMAHLSFVTALSFDARAAALQVREGDRVLAERRLSAHAPQVTVLSPNGGEELAAPLEIRWQAADADGDRLNYTVQYSADGGQTWQAIALGLQDPILRLESLDILTGSDLGKLRVLASDGLLTGRDESDGLFRVPNSPPLAALLSPAHRRVYALGSTVVLSGSATDREDGILPVHSLRWESDRDGMLGEGAELALDSLSAGLHVITLQATDSQGASDEAWVAIAIDPAVVVTHLSDAELQTVRVALEDHQASGPGIPQETAETPGGGVRGIVLVLGLVGVSLLGILGLGLLALGLRRRSG